ncbi:uncharacterized protein I303_103654 [Kwoniella dejecticola CBS 10117]|uniref:Serine aminopeptidase S33 domain-containing protein n=1 Tax=Kwoniella dejecticola CBS 10117 TaxID=1296121 RepID=A0AAJ8KP08_9TREE
MSQSAVWELVEPYLVNSGFYKIPDPTYGRYSLPPHPPHRILVDDTNVSHKYRRVFLRPFSSFADKHEAFDTTQVIHAEDVNLTEDEIYRGLQLGGRWICYSTWELKAEPDGGWEGNGKGLGKDIILAHGLGDYGLRYTPHVHHFLKAGFRVIIPDLPSYGRSTGVHSYLPSFILLPAALHVVLTDVVQQDLLRGKDQRKVFLCGASMGGWTVLERLRKDEKVRIDIAGAFVICPMVEVSKESRPSKFLEYIGRAISFIAGPLPFVQGVRGNVSDDPRVEEDFDSDPLCYHGLLRIGTGLAAVQAMTELEKRASEIDIPIRLIHGNKDRATSHLGTLKLFDRLPNADKEIQIYDGYEHVMMKVGIDAADDEKRQRVLADWRNWLLQRC